MDNTQKREKPDKDLAQPDTSLPTASTIAAAPAADFEEAGEAQPFAQGYETRDLLLPAETASLHLAALVESSDDAIVSKSLDGVILSWNQGAERIFGYTAEEVIGKSILILIPPDRTDEERLILARLKRGERIEHYDTVRQAKDGRLLNISLTVSPIRDKTGRIIAASKIARDITGRKQAEARLREQAEIIETIHRVGRLLSAELNLETLVQSVTDSATSLIGARFGAFFYNVFEKTSEKTGEKSGESYMLYTLSGVPREAFAHFPMPRATDLFGPTFRGEGTLRIANVRKDPRYGRNSPYYGMPEGHLPVTSYLAVPVVSRSGEVLGGLFFGHPDEGVFTERHEQIVGGLAVQGAIAMDNARLYELSESERAKAEAANRAKDEFLATVSHELRTPLNAIIGWSHMLRHSPTDAATTARALEVIERNARLQSQLVEDILDVSSVITGKLRLKVEPVDLAAVINAALDSVQMAADAKGIQLALTLDPSARHLAGDANRLQQVVWNLLANAIKFTPAGGRVEVRLERASPGAQVVVSDTGEGISGEFLPFIFDRFRQADSSRTRKYGGLGLGLAIVRHLVELHGGTVRAESAGENHGSTFTLHLPGVVNGRQPLTEDARRSDEDERASLQPLRDLSGVCVLAVDDNQDTLLMLTLLLEECGARVQTAASVTEALTIITDQRPDVLVCDLAMPVEDGYALIRRLRALSPEHGGQLPAVLLTAYVKEDEQERALALGFNRFVAKPVNLDELTTAIAELTAGNGLRTED